MIASQVAPRQLKIVWWNAEVVSSVWFSDAFWELVQAHDIVFLTETHHTILPCKYGWQVEGEVRDQQHSEGGVLALFRLSGAVSCLRVTCPFDGFLWLQVLIHGQGPINVGGAYVPGCSDPRYRALQGGLADHFDSLSEQVSNQDMDLWVLGGDFNAIIATSQPAWGTSDPLNFRWKRVQDA